MILFYFGDWKSFQLQLFNVPNSGNAGGWRVFAELKAEIINISCVVYAYMYLLGEPGAWFGSIWYHSIDYYNPIYLHKCISPCRGYYTRIATYYTWRICALSLRRLDVSNVYSMAIVSGWYASWKRRRPLNIKLKTTGVSLKLTFYAMHIFHGTVIGAITKEEEIWRHVLYVCGHALSFSRIQELVSLDRPTRFHA